MTARGSRRRRSATRQRLHGEVPREAAPHRDPGAVRRSAQTRSDLGERDCSMQRRHQKVIEEAPAPGMPRRLSDRDRRPLRGGRARRWATSARARSSSSYENGEFYFIEMNTRVQVEHPVTELHHRRRHRAGTRSASRPARSSPFAQRDIELRGHAIECRINAEDPVQVHAVAGPADDRGTRRAGRASASIRTPTTATSCRRTTIR